MPIKDPILRAKANRTQQAKRRAELTALRIEVKELRAKVVN
jgi:hypothetical protein